MGLRPSLDPTRKCFLLANANSPPPQISGRANLLGKLQKTLEDTGEPGTRGYGYGTYGGDVRHVSIPSMANSRLNL